MYRCLPSRRLLGTTPSLLANAPRLARQPLALVGPSSQLDRRLDRRYQSTIDATEHEQESAAVKPPIRRRPGRSKKSEQPKQSGKPKPTRRRHRYKDGSEGPDARSASGQRLAPIRVTEAIALNSPFRDPTQGETAAKKKELRLDREATGDLRTKSLFQDPEVLAQAKQDDDPRYIWPHLPRATSWIDTTLGSEKPTFLGKGRYILSNKKTVDTLIERLDLDDIVRQNGGQKVTIVEAFPGAGTLTRQLLEHEAVEKVIAMEEQRTYLSWLTRLQDDPTISPQDRAKLSILKLSGYNWESYEELESLEHLKHIIELKDQSTEEALKVSPLVFIAQLPNSIHGDQLYVQLLSAVINGQWLYKYGRVKTVFVGAQSMAEKSMSPVGTPLRAKLATIASIFTLRKFLMSYHADLAPISDNFYPVRMHVGRRVLATTEIKNDHVSSRLPFQDMAAFEVVPRRRQVLTWLDARRAREAGEAEYSGGNSLLNHVGRDEEPGLSVPTTADAWEAAITGIATPYLQGPSIFQRGMTGIQAEALDYLLRNLFVLRGSSVKEALEKTYPGASSILSKLAPSPDDPALKYEYPSKNKRQYLSSRRRLVNPSSSSGTLSLPPLFVAPMTQPTDKAPVTINPLHSVGELTDDQWLAMTEVFERWPFRPDYLFAEGRVQFEKDRPDN